MSQITTHILDTSTGKPAVNVPLELFQLTAGKWQKIATGSSDDDGRVQDLLANNRVLEAGSYKIYFDTLVYFQNATIESFYPWVEIVFSVTGDGQHYHIPLLLSPFGYSTYRGS